MPLYEVNKVKLLAPNVILFFFFFFFFFFGKIHVIKYCRLSSKTSFDGLCSERRKDAVSPKTQHFEVLTVSLHILMWPMLRMSISDPRKVSEDETELVEPVVDMTEDLRDKEGLSRSTMMLAPRTP